MMSSECQTLILGSKTKTRILNEGLTFETSMQVLNQVPVLNAYVEYECEYLIKIYVLIKKRLSTINRGIF